MCQLTEEETVFLRKYAHEQMHLRTDRVASIAMHEIRVVTSDLIPFLAFFNADPVLALEAPPPPSSGPSPWASKEELLSRIREVCGEDK